MSDPKLRLFFALWPDAATRAAIADLALAIAQETRGRAPAPEKVHLTLAFLGSQPASLLPTLQSRASSIEVPGFKLLLDQLGCWRQSGIAWLGASEVPPELITLYDRIASACASLGLPKEDRPFAPHLTLARRVTTPARRRLVQPVVWPVSSFALVASETHANGAIYRTLASWMLVPLRAGEAR